MICRSLFLLVFLALPAAAQEAKASACTTSCHGKEATAYRRDVHRHELGCTDCHGGDAEATRDQERAHDPARGFRGRPAREAIPELCGNCHADPRRMALYSLATDELARYRVSAHGIAVLQRGRTEAAVCSDCHDSHGILSSKDRRSPTAPINQPATCARCHADEARMNVAHLPHDTVARYLGSVHGRVLIDEDARGAPSCADCHGAHGARPPGINSVVQVCSRCHSAVGEIYRASVHGGSDSMNCRVCHMDDVGRDYDRSGCTTCHGAHSIAEADETMLEGDAPVHCGHCHIEPGAAQEFVRVVQEGRALLRERLHQTRAACDELRERGLFLENEAGFLRESQRAIVSARPRMHGVDSEAMRRHFEDGALRQERAREIIERKHRVLRDRAIVLGGIALFLLMFAAVLGVRVRELRRLR